MSRFNCFTSTYWHLSGPRAITFAHSVLRTSSQEVARLTAVHQGVAKAGQIHSHYVDVKRTLRLLTGMGCRENLSTGVRLTQTGRMDE